MVVSTRVRLVAIAGAVALAVAGISVPGAASAAGPTFGSVAGQNLPQCFANTFSVPDLDDGVTGAIPLGFTIDYNNVTYSNVYIDADGKLEFTNIPADYQVDYTTYNRPLISAWGTNVDMNPVGGGGGTLTYGTANGTFCAVWDSVQPSGGSTARNTFQALISSASGAPGRVVGDFDVTLNYDSLQWDDSSIYHGASVGMTPGVNTPGLAIYRNDSNVDNAFLDSSPTAMIRDHRGTSQGGRYIYAIYNVPNDLQYGTMVSNTPFITGTGAIGTALTANAGGWGPAPVSFDYQWNRDGVAIAGQTGSNYIVAEADLKHVVTVTLTGHKIFYADAAATSGAFAVQAGTLHAATPKISGTAKVGKTLKITKGTWTPAPSFSYQWYANGKAIKKATKSSYKIAASVKGKKITVKVTGKRTGYTTAVKLSKATGKVKR